MTPLLVALGAALGGTLRFTAGHHLDRRFPWGTVAVNLLGSLLLGTVSGAGLTGDAAAMLGAGFCGGLTTYSAFVVQAHDAGPRRGWGVVLLTLPPALALCALGYAAGAALTG